MFNVNHCGVSTKSLLQHWFQWFTGVWSKSCKCVVFHSEIKAETLLQPITCWQKYNLMRFSPYLPSLQIDYTLEVIHAIPHVQIHRLKMRFFSSVLWWKTMGPWNRLLDSKLFTNWKGPPTKIQTLLIFFYQDDMKFSRLNYFYKFSKIFS